MPPSFQQTASVIFLSLLVCLFLRLFPFSKIFPSVSNISYWCFAFLLWYSPFFLLYSSLFIWSAYVSPIQLAVSPLLFLCSHLPACPYSRFPFFIFSVFVRLCWRCLSVLVPFIVRPVHGDYLRSSLSLSLSLFLEFHLERTPLLTSSHPPELAGKCCYTPPRAQRGNPKLFSSRKPN